MNDKEVYIDPETNISFVRYKARHNSTGFNAYENYPQSYIEMDSKLEKEGSTRRFFTIKTKDKKKNVR